MCTVLLGLAAAGVAMSAAGTIMGASQQRSVAQAQMNAQVQSQEAQSQAFFQRMGAQQQQNVRDAATQNQAVTDEQAAQQQLQQQQQQATQQREAQIQQANAETTSLAQRGQTAIQTAEAAASPDALNAAKAQEVQQIQTLAAPGIQNVATGTANTPTGPVAAPPSTSNETASAIATRLAQAASATRDYAGREATVASESAPLVLMNTTTENLANTTAPLAAEQKTVEGAMPTLLTPSTVAYQQAGNYYQNLLNAIQARTQGQLNISKAIASGDISSADLAQADTTTQAQNQATLAQYNAAMNPTASILSGVGQLATYGAGAMGAGSQLSSLLGGGGSGAGPLSSTAGWLSGVTGSNLGGFGAPAVGTDVITPYWRGLMSGASV